MDNNMKIWDQVCTTNQEFTKEATGKGFSCTSINPNYIYKTLTEMFGPCGIGWGYKVLSDQYKEGHEAIFKDVKNKEVLHVVQVALWYVFDGKRSEDVPAFGQTFFVRCTSGGWKMDEEAPKKSLTDALTKAASMLGVSADIYSGKWDGHKDQGGNKTPPKKTPPTNTPPANTPPKTDPVAWGLVCPKCDSTDSIIKSKYKEGEFVCYEKKNGGCGFKFTPKPPEAGDGDDVPMGEPPQQEYISEADRKKLFAKSNSVGWSNDELKDFLEGSYGIKSTKEIPADMFSEILSYMTK